MFAGVAPTSPVESPDQGEIPESDAVTAFASSSWNLGHCCTGAGNDLTLASGCSDLAWIWGATNATTSCGSAYALINDTAGLTRIEQYCNFDVVNLAINDVGGDYILRAIGQWPTGIGGAGTFYCKD